MRSQALLRRPHSLLRNSLSYVCFGVRPCRLKQPSAASHRPVVRLQRRLASSTSLPVALDPDAPIPPVGAPEAPEESSQEKPKRRVRLIKEPDGPPQLPHGLNIVWAPEADPSEADPSALPPPDILEEVLNNLRITLLPKTQHRATYASSGGPPLEPTLALYCPIEGGDYVIDATVQELARRTNAEVIVMDSVQLAAGECGHFGKGANSLQLPQNPLHFPSASNNYSRAGNLRESFEDSDEADVPQGLQTSPSMTVALVGAALLRGRAYVAPTSRNAAPSKARIFFDEVVNASFNNLEASSSPGRPRIIYVRDFAVLAPTSSVWYPPLLSAVRQRRQGATSRPSSPIANPTIIVFGITPPITPPSTSQGSGGLVGLLRHRSSQPTSVAPQSSKPGTADWSEDELSSQARERRLWERLRRWERSDFFTHDELPPLAYPSNAAEGDESHAQQQQQQQKPEVVVVENTGGGPSLPPALASALAARALGLGKMGASEQESSSPRFFRTSVLVPSVRSLIRERACRIARRKEINELTMKMGVSSVGGQLEAREAIVENPEPPSDRGEPTGTPSVEQTMWEDWGNRVEEWTNVKRIADHAVGSVVVLPSENNAAGKYEKPSLDATAVPWAAVHHAWAAQRMSRESRRVWMKESSGKAPRQQHDKSGASEQEAEVDEVVENVKQDPDLDQHEQRLLPCIVHAASMTTTFSQVHLPSHTIDSVRTIVSLPLLYPEAFSQGVLKEHGMTGCLLFGPPGTGKTLVVRALAKEAGCRMMAISPSDVMDMYVGEGEKLVRAVFSLARRLAPCVVFLDEIDALFGARMPTRESGGAFAHRGVITEFMQEMDGLRSSRDDNVIVIGATNRPFDLDDAVLRRLPRRLLVDLPGEKEREEILKIHLRDENLDPDLTLAELARRTESFSGSDLKHLCVSAALDAVKEHVDVPWKPKASAPLNDVSLEDAKAGADKIGPGHRVLALRHFNKALTEITPSSSESLGTLTDLRKWNEEFGEGRKHKKTRIWGRDLFGFTDKGQRFVVDGRVELPSRLQDIRSIEQR